MIRLTQPAGLADFERRIMPHLDAAYSLARFLVRNDQDAEDVVQEASLRAFRFYEGFRGENSRAWFLKIVRNTSFTALQRARSDEADIVFDEELRSEEAAQIIPATNRGSGFSSLTCRGYNLIHWTRGEMDYWAVSDLNAEELCQFAAHFAP
jgi:RNA polymerase sigma factor (sigma-70 family)